MARKKKKRGKQGWFSKLINITGVLIGLSRPITVAFIEGPTIGPEGVFKRIINELTFGFSDGGFDLNAGLRMYTPVAAAAGYRELTKYLLRRFPVR